MKEKKVISFILSLAMVFTMTTGLTALGFNAAADEVYAVDAIPTSGTCGAIGNEGNVTWSYDAESKTLKIEGTGAMADYVSGAPWNEHYHSYIETVNIVNGVTNVGDYAFLGCENLKNIEFEENTTVNKIGGGSFSRCDGLKTLTLSGIETIGEYAFSGCDKLSTLSLNKVETIGDGAFSGCMCLKNVSLDGVKAIGEEAFCHNTIETLILPNSLQVVSPKAFSECSLLESIIFLGDTMPSIAESAFDLGDYLAQSGPETCVVYVRPELVEEFAKTIKINNETLTTNKSDAFHVESLPAIVWMSQDGSDFLEVDLISEKGDVPSFLGSNPTKDPDSRYFYVFNGWATAPNQESGERVDDLPTGPATYYAAFAKHLPTDAKASGFCEGMKWKITYNDDFYAEGAVSDEVPVPWFACRSSIKSVNVSNVDKLLPKDAFISASALTNVKLSEVKNIYDEAFKDCTSLTTVNMSGAEYIENAFEGCTALTSISIPASVTSMPFDNTFSGCTSLTAITFNGNRPSDLMGLTGLPTKGVIKVKQEALESFTTGSAFTVNGRPVSTDAAVTEGWHYEFITAPSNHSGRGSNDSNPADKDAVKLGDATVAADVKISGDTAKVDSLAIEGLAAGGQVLSLDFSATAEVKKISVNKDILNKVQAGSEGLKLSVSGGNSQGSDLLQLKLDREALSSLKNQANGDVTFAMQTGSEAISSMNQQQKETLNKLKNHGVIEITIEAGGTTITKYGDGSIEISLTTPDLMNKAAAGAYLDKKGNLSAVKVTSDGDAKTILTNHLSHYMLVGVDSSTFEDVASNAFYKDAVSWAGTLGITAGTDDTHFSPSKDITRAEMVTFLWRAAGSPEPVAAATSFADIKENDYFYKAVLWAAEQGITTGTTATTFAPNEVITRGQAVSFLYRMNGIDTLDLKANPFTDVKDGSYYTDAVLWAANDGITSGKTATTFAPEESCNRGQVVTFMYRYYNK